jgi:hypothetical protein
MAELLVLEFEGFGQADYEKVNEILGIDSETGEGDWPEGILTHTAGPTENGWIVIEVWESQEHQDKFMKSRLGPALHTAGVEGPPRRADWSKVKAHHAPRRTSSKG